MAEVIDYAIAGGIRVSVRGGALVIRGLLRNELLDGAITHARSMRQEGFVVPSLAATEFYQLAASAHAWRIFWTTSSPGCSH